MGKPAQVELTEETPSQQAVAKAAAEHTFTDRTGRVITLKKPGVLAQFRLIEALGDTAKNEVYMNMVLPLIFVSKIDGEVVFLPNKKSEVEALIQRLDEEGVTDVMAEVQKHYGASNPDADKAALKN